MLNSFFIGIILVLVGSGYFYYSTTQTKLQEQQALIVAFEVKHQEQEKTIEALQTNFKKQTEALNELSGKYNAAQEEMNRYLDIFSRHNLSKLAAAKPGLIEKRINKGTSNVFRSIENDSSSIESTAK